MEGTAFTYLEHLVTLPVRVGEATAARFVLDTGIGPTIFSEALADRLSCSPNGRSFTGRRMSGQEVSVPLADAPPITAGTFTREDNVVGVLDTSGFPEPLRSIDGFLSLAFFEETPFTVDYARGAVIVETPATLAERVASGTPVAVRLERQWPSLVVFLPVTVPGLGSVDLEVDMGSDALILDARHAPAVGVDLNDLTIRRVEGADETGHAYVRHFTRLEGTIHVTGEPALAQAGTEVMFQEIIYDGLVGDAFLRRFAVTYDLPGARMIFG